MLPGEMFEMRKNLQIIPGRDEIKQRDDSDNLRAFLFMEG